MTSRKWVRLFLTTLLIGGVSALVVSFFVKTGSYANAMDPFNVWGILGLILWFLGLGFIFSLISQMGFFAYLTVHQFGLGMFKKSWNFVQVVLIAFTLFDLVYFRIRGTEGEPILPFLIIPGVILAFGWLVSYIKAKETNKQAFIPALFFMVVITSIEWVPALRVDERDWLMLMIVPLLACNTYQLLLLHRLTGEGSHPDNKLKQPPSSNKKKKKRKKSKR